MVLLESFTLLEKQWRTLQEEHVMWVLLQKSAINYRTFYSRVVHIPYFTNTYVFNVVI